MRLTRRKTRLLRVLTFTASLLICIGVLLGGELYLHRKHGINFSGYRGPELQKKQPGEQRIAILGGSTTWGFGLKAGQDFPAQLEQLIAQTPEAKQFGRIHVINLGANNDGAFSFKFTLNDYDSLDYDAVIFYSGYNDLTPNYFVFRHRLPVFSWTGYLPLLPLLTVDKLTVWQRKLLGQQDKPIFEPPRGGNGPVPEPLAIAAPAVSDTPITGSCEPEWKFYRAEMHTAIQLALNKGKRVLVVTEPYINARHVGQQQCLEQMLATQFKGNTNVRYLNLGETIDLRDQTLCWDLMHLTQEGNRRIALAMLPAAVELLTR